jgi:thioredoxin reductase
MHAARILAEQGNRVSVFESASELGGQMRYSSKVATDYGDLVTYLRGQMKRLKVEVHLDSFVDLKTIGNVSPSAVIVATGAGPGLRFCPWKDQPKTFNLFSALDRPDDDWEDRVVIIGGDSESCFLALYVAGRGAEVHVVEPKAVFSEDKMSPGRDLLMMALKNLPTVQQRTIGSTNKSWLKCRLLRCTTLAIPLSHATSIMPLTRLPRLPRPFDCGLWTEAPPPHESVRPS